MPQQPTVLNAQKAKQGRSGIRVFTVLAAGLVLALVVFLALML